jgi:lipid kinase YegS
VVNGKVAGDPTIRDEVARLRAAGHHLDVRVTWEDGDARRLAREGIDAGADVIVACGGDGTLNGVAAGILDADDHRASLAVVPMGTANDFALAACVPGEGVAPALCLAATGEPTAIDVGRVNDRVFINAATGGFGSRVTTATPDGLKSALGGLAYVLTALARVGDLRPEEGSIRGDDFAFEGPFWGLAICNGPLAGPQMRIQPEARISDGLLDVAVLPRLDAEGRRLAAECGGDEQEGLVRLMVTGRVKRLEIELAADLDLNLDGEPLTGRRFTIEAVPGALRCVLPERCPLIG